MFRSPFCVRLTLWLAAAAPATAGTPSIPDKAPAPRARTGGWRVSAGFMHRSLQGVDWLTGTQSVPDLLTIGAGSNTEGIDSIGRTDAFADRLYNDGFVRLDGGTVANGGDTWNWGYQNASQVSGDTLAFHGGNGTAATFTNSTNYEYGGWSDGLEGTAPFVQLEWIQPMTEHLNIGFQTSLMILNSGASRRLATFTADKSRTDYSISYTDTYALQGAIPPEAPYAGSLTGPGMVITNLPANRTATHTVSGGETGHAFNSISTEFDMTLATLSFGPVLEYSRGRFSLLASAGLTLNIADWETNQRETLFVSHDNGPVVAQNGWRHRSEGTEVLPGAFLQAAISTQLTERWSVGAFGRYDFVGHVTFDTGPSSGSADLSGWSLGGTVAFSF